MQLEFGESAASIRVRLLIKCGFYTRLYGKLKVSGENSTHFAKITVPWEGDAVGSEHERRETLVCLHQSTESIPR